MDAVAYVLARHQQGDRISLKHDVFGNYWAVVRRGWLFARKERVGLNRAQFFALTSDTSDLARRTRIAA